MILRALWHVFISFKQTALFFLPDLIFYFFVRGLFAFLLISRQTPPPSKPRGAKEKEAQGNRKTER